MFPLQYVQMVRGKNFPQSAIKPSPWWPAQMVKFFLHHPPLHQPQLHQPTSPRRNFHMPNTTSTHTSTSTPTHRALNHARHAPQPSTLHQTPRSSSPSPTSACCTTPSQWLDTPPPYMNFVKI